MTGTTNQPEPQHGVSDAPSEQQQQSAAGFAARLPQKPDRPYAELRRQQAQLQGRGDFGI